MDLLISDKWLRDFLKTKATPKQIEKYLSLCGPSVERTQKTSDGDTVYSIEITTNRVDSASVYGIAREASAILPRLGIKANLKKIDDKTKQRFVKNVKYLSATVDPSLCPRFTVALIKNVNFKDSPKWVKERLASAGERPINNIVDISNFVMHELGQPVHTFDYDKIKGARMILRNSKKGEAIKTLDEKTHKLSNEDMVIEDGDGRLIDLSGIMGGKLSAIDKKTKNVLLFVQTYNPQKVRQSSMSLAHRTEGSALFEKGTDPELVPVGMARAIELFEKLTGGKVENEILDIYPNPKKVKSISVKKDIIDNLIGINIPKAEINKYLEPLGFKAVWEKDVLNLKVPSYRYKDIEIPEDVVEEIARMYGYHNLPSKLMSGDLPEKTNNNYFSFERKIKDILKELKAIETYTLSLVSRKEVEKSALKLKNPLGKDAEFLRTSLTPSLINAARQNKNIKDSFHIFEMANVYIPRMNNLPEEQLMLAGIFANYDFRKARGIVEKLLETLNITHEETLEELKGYKPSQRLVYKTNGKEIGEFGNLEKGYTYYEFPVQKLHKHSNPIKSFTPPAKHPPQIEDVTLVLPEKTKVGEVIKTIKSINQLISKAELKTVYKDSFTFNIWYQDPKKTLDNKEVEIIREKILKVVKSKFGATLKD